MKTLLLTWNPEHFPWDDFAEDVEDVRAGRGAAGGWSVGVRRGGVEPGDRFFMLRQGHEPRGIMASGTIESTVYQGRHWNRPGTANYVNIVFDALVDPDAEPERMIPISELIERFGGRFYFTRVQQSGQMLPDDVAAELEHRWAELHGPIEGRISDGHSRDEEPEDAAVTNFEPLPGEIDGDEEYVEGAVYEAWVNAYERNAAARQACIEHWGTRCCVCGFDFEAVYGALGCGFIEVHHLVPLAEIRDEYVIDPVQDLLPVCPNCHAMLHRQNPPLSIERLQRIIRERKGQE